MAGLEAGAYYVHAMTTSDGHGGEVYDDVTCVEVAVRSDGRGAGDRGALGHHRWHQLRAAARRVDRREDHRNHDGCCPLGSAVWASSSSGFGRSTTTNGAGEYTLAGLTVGECNRYARAGTADTSRPCYPDVPCDQGGSCSGPGTPVAVTSGATTSAIDMALQAGGRLTGTVTDALTGAPVSSVSVRITTASGSVDRWVTTDPAGRYTLDSLHSGSYYLRTNDWGDRDVDQLYQGVRCRDSCPLAAGTPIAVTAGTLPRPDRLPADACRHDRRSSDRHLVERSGPERLGRGVRWAAERRAPECEDRRIWYLCHPGAGSWRVLRARPRS